MTRGPPVRTVLVEGPTRNLERGRRHHAEVRDRPDHRRGRLVSGLVATGAMTAERFARAVAASNRTTLRDLMAGDIDFRAMTPSRFWEARAADDVVEIIVSRWF